MLMLGLGLAGVSVVKVSSLDCTDCSGGQCWAMESTFLLLVGNN